MLLELVDFSLILVSNKVCNALSTPLFSYKSMLDFGFFFFFGGGGWGTNSRGKAQEVNSRSMPSPRYDCRWNVRLTKRNQLDSQSWKFRMVTLQGS